LALGIGQLEGFSAVFEASGEIADDRQVVTMMGDESAAVAGHHEEGAGVEGHLVGEAEADAAAEGPTGEGNGFKGGVMEFDPL
jgi:hypothetical protein